MPNFPKKRIQVFVSSTYIDLIEERQAAVEAILTMGHIPAGMELFTAGDESQMEVIRQWIDESDAYLLILGGRYGSIEPKSDKSYIHLEYEYALNRNMPFFACVMHDDIKDERVKRYGVKVIEQDNPEKLRLFRNLVCSKMVRHWRDTKDIKIAIHETLSGFSRKDDLVGWVKGSDQVNVAALTDELARLSEENGRLRKQLGEVLANKQTFAGMTYDEVIVYMKNQKVMAILRKSYDISITINNLLEFFWYLQRGLVSGFLLDRFYDFRACFVDLISLDLVNESYLITTNGKSLLNRIKLYEMQRFNLNEAPDLFLDDEWMVCKADT